MCVCCCLGFVNEFEFDYICLYVCVVCMLNAQAYIYSVVTVCVWFCFDGNGGMCVCCV